MGGGSNTNLGTGGMKTKLNAAKICCDAGSDMWIINGNDPSLLYDVIDGKSVGTHFIASQKGIL